LVSTSFSSPDDKGLLLAIKCHLRAKKHLSCVCPASSMGSLSNAGRRAREGIHFKMAQELRLGMHANPTKNTKGMTVPSEIFFSLSVALFLPLWKGPT